MGRGETDEQQFMLDLDDVVRVGISEAALEIAPVKAPIPFLAYRLEAGQKFLFNGEPHTMIERDTLTDREHAVIWATRDDGGDEVDIESDETVTALT